MTLDSNNRRVIATVLATVACPIVLSGCIIGLFPLGVPRAVVPVPTPTLAADPSPTSQAAMPDLPIADLPGAPAFAVWAPERNAQIRVSIWRSGSLNGQLVVPLLNRDPVYLDHVRVTYAPTGDFFAVVEAADGPTISRAFVRIFSSSGDLVWTGPGDISAHPAMRWSPDGTRIAIDSLQRWLVVTPRGPGQAEVVEIDARRPRAAIDAYAYPWELLDFSEDGATLFGSRSGGLPRYELPLARVASSGGPIEPLATLPTKAGQCLAALRDLLDEPLEAPIDPRTGAIAFPTGAGGSADVTVTVRSDKRDRTFTLARAAGGAVTMAGRMGPS